jgi:hypothetical protein
MRKLVFALLLATSLPLPAIAADSPSCVRRNDIRDWASPARRTLILENYAHAKVMLKMEGSCLGFGPYDGFQISGPTETAASCVAAGDTVRTHWAGEPGICHILSVTPYSGEMHPAGAHHTIL